MLRFADFLLVLGLFGVCRTEGFQIIDDFTGPALDANSWQSYLGFANSSLTVTNGYLRVRNGAELISRKPFSAPLEIEGQLRFSGGPGDNLALVFRSSGQRHVDSIEPTNGIVIRIEPQGDSGINSVVAQREGDSFVYATGARTLVKNQFYPFRLSDTGTNFSFYLGDLATPLLAGKETSQPGDKVVLFNHLASGEAQFDLDSITVRDYVPATLNIYTAAEVTFQTRPGILYQLQASPDGQTWTNLLDRIQGDGGPASRLFSTRGQGKLYYRAQEISTGDQLLIQQAEDLPGVIDCVARLNTAGLRISAGVERVGSCSDGDQKQVVVYGAPNCEPGQVCPQFVVIIARVTFDCQGQVISTECL